jgi:hypothetical protein
MKKSRQVFLLIGSIGAFDGFIFSLLITSYQWPRGKYFILDKLTNEKEK